ncbi:MAG: HAMP domain-containing histidine kinase, partial [Lachnospiraceae bacterium]|nr:HAMP domain-containing histidine kinase [Lachnospiraceae bacterium]
LLFPLSYLLLFQLAGMIGMLQNKDWIQHSLCYCFFRILVRDKGIRRKLLLELLFGYVVISALVIAGFIPLFWNDLKLIVPLLVAPLLLLLTIFLGVACIILFRPGGEVTNMLRISDGIDRMVKGEEVSGNPVSSNSVFFKTGEQLVKMEEHVKKAVETARSSEQLKVELITNVSHDLKTPLSAIIGYGELLKQQELEAEAGELVDKINQKSYQLREMLGDVMELSKVSSGVIQGKREVLNLIKLMEQSLGELQDAIAESGLELRKQYSEEEAYIESDGMLLHQVFQNLFQNALKYSLAGSRIYIQVQTGPEQIIVRIMNTASYEMRFDPERITDSFVRGEESRTGEGHGLGLAIASTYTNACGGTFDIAVSGDQFQTILTFERYLKD